jgi:hypothetical protein
MVAGILREQVKCTKIVLENMMLDDQILMRYDLQCIINKLFCIYLRFIVCMWL